MGGGGAEPPFKLSNKVIALTGGIGKGAEKHLPTNSLLRHNHNSVLLLFYELFLAKKNLFTVFVLF